MFLAMTGKFLRHAGTEAWDECWGEACLSNRQAFPNLAFGPHYNEGLLRQYVIRKDRFF